MNVMRKGRAPAQTKGEPMNQVFAIAADDRIMPVQEAGSPGQPSFSCEEELAHAVVRVSLKQLVNIWNQLPGVVPLRRFENRAVAVARIWQVLVPQAER